MAKLLSAHGYQGDARNLPVADVGSAVPFYLKKMGFHVVEKIDQPVKMAVLERDGVQFAIAENGGDPGQDGCAFYTDDIGALRGEFIANGYQPGNIKLETRADGSKFDAFFAIAPDGLCFWFGQRR